VFEFCHNPVSGTRIGSQCLVKQVEVVASEKMGRETVQYVSNTYKYYPAYQINPRTAG
jgi:hypothetical protein